MATGTILREEREKRDKSQQEIANYLHIARATYTRYENGTITPTTDNLIKLADLYNLSVDYLLGRKI